MSKTAPVNTKLGKFLAMAGKTCNNPALIKCWYRSLPRNYRDLTINSTLVKQFTRDQKRA